MLRTSSYLSLILVLFFISCKDEVLKTDAQSIDIEIDKGQSISLSDLTIYPIINNTEETNKLSLLSELYDQEGVLFKTKLEESELNFSYRPNFYIVNKSSMDAYLPFGEILNNTKKRYVLNAGSDLIQSKKITHIRCQQVIYGQSINTEVLDRVKFTPVLACPPIPLNKFLFGKDQEASEWLKTALPKLDFVISSNNRNNPIEIDFFSGSNKEKHSLRKPMRSLENVGSFQHHFANIADAPHVSGCLVTYKGRIVIARLFRNGYFFRKEWPNIIRSIYLNQAMGYTTSEFNQLKEFKDTEAAKAHTLKLWNKAKVLPKDNAYRGDSANSAMELVWF